MARNDTYVHFRIDHETKLKAALRLKGTGISMADFLRLCLEDLNDGGEMTKIATYAKFKKIFRNDDDIV